MSGKMERAHRAKQFMPFAALSGLDDAIYDAGRLIVEQICLGEDGAAELDNRLHALSIGSRIVVVYYENGAYQERSGLLRRIDQTQGYLVIDGLSIPIDSLLTVRELLA